MRNRGIAGRGRKIKFSLRFAVNKFFDLAVCPFHLTLNGKSEEDIRSLLLPMKFSLSLKNNGDIVINQRFVVLRRVLGELD
jgi:hypothetical protein